MKVGCGGGRAAAVGRRVRTMVNIQSKSQARWVVREAQAKANEQRAQRDRDNLDDMAVFLVTHQVGRC